MNSNKNNINNSINELADFLFYKLEAKVNNNKKEYETFNFVSDDGDSIYTVDNKEFTTSKEGQVFISEDKIKDFINQLIKEVRALNNKNE